MPSRSGKMTVVGAPGKFSTPDRELGIFILIRFCLRDVGTPGKLHGKWSRVAVGYGEVHDTCPLFPRARDAGSRAYC